MSTTFRPRLRLAGAATVVAALLAVALGAVLTLDDVTATSTARLGRSPDARQAANSRPAVALAPASVRPPSDAEVVTPPPPSSAESELAPTEATLDGGPAGVSMQAPMATGDDDDDHARAARLLGDLAAQTDRQAASIIGEALAPLVAVLDPTGRRALLALARDGDAPRPAALNALGRLEPTADTVDLVRQAVLSRPSREARAAGVDALALLAERGAPGDLVEAAILELTDPAF